MSGYEFPDVEKALLEIVPGGTLWLRSTEGTVHHIYGVGGSETGPLRTDRITINTYAPSRDEAKDAAEEVRALLTSGAHETEVGVLDHVEAEVVPRSIPFQSDTTSQYQAVYRVDTRAT